MLNLIVFCSPVIQKINKIFMLVYNHEKERYNLTIPSYAMALSCV